MSEYASPVDTARHGHYRIPAGPGPLHRFTGRIGTPEWPAEVGRYHLYGGWFCPWSHRVVLQRALNGLEGVVSLSYVDDARDGRGWAFRERRGADPVNGFTLLREAYEATEPGFDGHVSTPVLWDRRTGRVVSNEYAGIGIDLATRFGGSADLYPAALRGQIEELDDWIGPAVNRGVGAAAGHDEQAGAARFRLLAAFADLDRRLATRRYLLGDRITEADLRLWVTLVRYGAGLAAFPRLWAYARDLYQQPAFASTTDFDSFTPPGTTLPDWHAPHERERLAVATA